MTVSKISRKDASACSTVDSTTIVTSMPSWDAYISYIRDKQTAGNIIYRSTSINVDGEMETVTLYVAEADYITFKADPIWAALEADLSVVYNVPVVTEQTV